MRAREDTDSPATAFPEVGATFPPVCLAEVIVRDTAHKEEALECLTREAILTCGIKPLVSPFLSTIVAF